MIDSLRDAIASLEERRRVLEVVGPSVETAHDLAELLASNNVSVTFRQAPIAAEQPRVVVRDDAGERLRSVPLDSFRRLAAPQDDQLGGLTEASGPILTAVEVLEETIFRAFDRRQLLATSREIEGRALRIHAGRLYTGFQNADALRAQVPVYRRLAGAPDLTIHLFVHDGWPADLLEGPTVHVSAAEEIGAFWFVVYDGGEASTEPAALIAEERDPGRFTGFWTYEPGLVADIVGYLDRAYVDTGS